MALANWPKGITEDRYDWRMEGYSMVESKIDTLFELKNPTQGSYDQKTTAIGMGKLVQKSTDDTSVTYRRPSEAFTAYSAYRDFDDGISLTKNEVDDFPQEKVKDLMKETITSWGQAEALTEDDFAATLFTKGGFTAGHANFSNVVGNGNILNQNTDNLAYDAKPAFNLAGNERTSKGGGTYYNAISGTGLSVAGFATLYKLLFVTNAKNERDERISLKLGTTVLLIPPQLRDAATQTLESERLPGGNFNDKNPYLKACQIVEWDAINPNASAWYIGVAKMGIRFYRRGKTEIRTFRDEDTGAYKASIRARYGFMFWNFRFWAAANAPTV